MTTSELRTLLRRIQRCGHAHQSWLAQLLVSFAAIFLLSHSAQALDITLQVNAAPPALPVYDQPPIPAPGYLWTPGYWAYGPDGWFWVPGTWVEPPAPGLVWTPGYWSWSDGVYVWNAGYWAPQVGFYGGIDYGFGYVGQGYEGGYWQGDQFFYNRAVNNVTNVNITNVYTRNVTNVTTVNTVSYNGGAGGVTARPTPQEMAVAHQHHQGPTAMQMQQVSAASTNHDLLASVNHGHPPIAATPKPGALSGSGVVRAHGAGDSAPAAATVRRDGPRPDEAPTEHKPAAPIEQAPPPRHLAEAPAPPTDARQAGGTAATRQGEAQRPRTEPHPAEDQRRSAEPPRRSAEPPRRSAEPPRPPAEPPRRPEEQRRPEEGRPPQ